MRHLPRPNSAFFRTVSVLAALAWLVLASGALAAPSPLAAPAPSGASAQHCDGMPMVHAKQRGHASEMPMGSGDCCHGGCHCASACSVALSVPRVAVVAPRLQDAFPIAAPADPVPALSAPPLRPPIA